MLDQQAGLALADFDSAIALRPRCVCVNGWTPRSLRRSTYMAYAQHALLHLQAGDAAATASLFDRMIQLFPGSADALCCCGQVRGALPAAAPDGRRC